MIDVREAQRDFDHAINQASWQKALGLLTGKNYNLVEYNEVRKRLEKINNAPPQLKEIPISSIVGTVSRSTDFSRTFLPKMAHDKHRWVRVKVANESYTGVPPIDVYQIGEVYFVIDGHHRVSVMKSNGAKYIMANVRAINTDVPLEPDDSPDAIIVKTERQAFLERTNIARLIPDAKIEMKLAGEYPELCEHIAVHQYFMGLEQQRPIDEDDAVTDWYYHVYLPVTDVIRDQHMLDQFPNKTEAELYLWIENNKAALTEEYGEDLRNTALAWKLDDQYGRRNRSFLSQLKRAFYLIFTPDLSDWGVRTGDWRREFVKDDKSPLIRRMMISVADTSQSMDYLRSGIRFSKMYHAWVGIVHVVKRSADLNADSLRQFEQDVTRLLEEEGVKGKVFILKGQLLKNLSERAFWSDISLFRMNYRPSANQSSNLGSGWNSIIMRVPGPIFVTPDHVPERINRMILAFSQSPKAREAMYFADALSKTSTGQITVVISGKHPQKIESARVEAQEYFESHGLNPEILIRPGDPTTEILRAAEEDQADLIVMGGYTLSYWLRNFRKSSVEKVMAGTKVPVILCK